MRFVLVVPFFASSSAFSLPQCPSCPAIHLTCTVFVSLRVLRALWHSRVVLLFIVIFARASIEDWLSVKKTMVLLLAIVFRASELTLHWLSRLVPLDILCSNPAAY